MTSRTLSPIFAIALLACGKDKECAPPKLEDQIVGTWNGILVSEHGDPQELTFEGNGNFKEINGLLFSTFLKSEDKWRVRNDSLFVEGKFSNGSAAKHTFSIVS